MKIKIVLFALSLIFGLQTTFANTSSSTTNGIEPIVAEDFSSVKSAADAQYVKVVKEEKKGLGNIFSWIKNKVNKVVKKFAQLGGLGDPVDKWFWFWIIGWGAAIVLSIIASAIFVGTLTTGGFGIASIIWIIAYLAGLFGTVSLIVWLVKKFA